MQDGDHMPAEPRKTAIVIGASRGLGLAITRGLLEDPKVRRVYASYRQAETAQGLLAIEDTRLHCAALDVTGPESISSLTAQIRENEESPNFIVHCAGILHEKGVQPEKSLAQCDEQAIGRVFEVNSIGPLMLARSLVPLMPRHEPSHFTVLSAMVGSISDNRLGGWYAYRASKAALNQFMRTLSIECRRTHPGLCVTSIHPGTTDTGLSQPFQANVKPGKLYTPEQSARRILTVIMGSTPGDSGQFVNWDGRPISP